MKKIAPDKWKHLWAGVAIGIVVQALLLYTITHHMWAALVTFSVVVIISYGFELFSKITGKGHYEILDAVASIIGGLLGIVLVWIATSIL